MSESPDSRPRLDSWKAIAKYLNRDATTVRRWEKLGLPVRRLPGGRGRSVFAYCHEIDEWLRTASDVQSQPPPVPEPRRDPSWLRWTATAVVTALVSVGLWYAASRRVSADDLRAEVTPEGVVAFDAEGRERWRHPFSAAFLVHPMRKQAVVATGATPVVYAGTTYKVRRVDDQAASGELMELDITGSLLRTFSFADRISFGQHEYAPPWALSAFAVDDRSNRRRIAVAGRHFHWSPSLVTILDAQWQRGPTFGHAGWIESIHWLAPDRLLIGGFSQPRDGGTLVLLDAAALDGQLPGTSGTKDFCDGCGSRAPLKIVVMPRSEVNRAAAAPFNKATVEMLEGRFMARTLEVPAPQFATEVLYEFDSALDLISASFGDRYWETHRALEREGKLTHSRDQCAERDGPRTIQVWEPATGWTTKEIRRSP